MRYLDGCKIRHIKHTPSLPVKTVAAATADPPFSNHGHFLLFMISIIIMPAQQEMPSPALSRGRPPGVLGKEEVVGIIMRVT